MKKLRFFRPTSQPTCKIARAILTPPKGAKRGLEPQRSSTPAGIGVGRAYLPDFYSGDRSATSCLAVRCLNPYTLMRSMEVSGKYARPTNCFPLAGFLPRAAR